MKRREFLQSSLAAAVMAGWAKPAWSAQGGASVKRVLVVSKCHLDVGFTDTQANVMRKYFDQYFPQAMATAKKLREQGGTNRYTWTTGSWLLYEYLEQATPEQRRAMEQAIAAKDIAWHALPFSWETEVLDRSMIKGCLGFSRELDARFGTRTIAGRMTDVPGHSRGLVPALAAEGITLLNIGVNPASTWPQVPEVFRWQAPDGSSVMVLYNTRDYGSVIEVPGTDLAIAIQVGPDNAGPHTEQQISDTYRSLGQRFPNATIAPASFSDVARALAATSMHVPTFTQEIGDTWIYGVASDPPKIARFREMSRLRREWVEAGLLAAGGANDRQLLRRLALAAEHTWGTDTKRYIDQQHYPPGELAEHIDQPNYQLMERSWREKRDDIDAGIATLPDAMQAEARTRLEGLAVKAPDPAGMKRVTPGKAIKTAHFEVVIDAKNGAITRLTERATKRSWASTEHPLALFAYQTLDHADYKRFMEAYVTSKEDWAPQDFGKPNFEKFSPQSRSWHPVVKNLWVSREKAGRKILVELAIEDPKSQAQGLVAWPRQIFLELTFPDSDPRIDCTLSVLGKTPNRMPEAMWLTFQPELRTGASWTLDKVDHDVSIEDVVRGGSRTLHAVTSGFRCRDGENNLKVTTLDAPVVALGTRSPLNFSFDLPDPGKGVHVCLFNNAWGTNYPQWAGGDWKYRFSIQSILSPTGRSS